MRPNDIHRVLIGANNWRKSGQVLNFVHFNLPAVQRIPARGQLKCHKILCGLLLSARRRVGRQRG